MATVLALASGFAAEPPHPLLGLTRDQVLQRLGEPRSQLSAGSRSVMLYLRERVVLRDGIVVDVERIYTAPVRRATPAPAPAAPAAGGAEQAAAAPGQTAPAAVPATPGEAAPGAVAPTAAAATPQASPAAPQDAAGAPSAEPPPPPEPRLEIKLVRPPSAGSPRPQPLPPRPTLPVAPPPPAPTPDTEAPAAKLAAVVAVPAPAAEEPTVSTKVATSPETAKAGSVTDVPVRKEPPVAAVEETAPAADREKLEQEEAAAKAESEKKAKVIKAARRRMEATIDSAADTVPPPMFTTQTIVLALVVVGGGLGFMIWRLRQRQLELAASAVSHSPFSAPAAGNDGGGSLFFADHLARLEWKRFEELVEAYYSKTGVVAARSKGGPSRPAQVRISWKGEPRPFALVRCISQPDGLIDVAPLQELFTVLASEDVRRGYVVTTGRFSVPARDYAEEKHLTLLPGDIFLEKLNALPGAARAEIMQAVTAGDYTTPSCPVCEAKMAQSSEDPPVWRCTSHPEVTLKVQA